MFPLLHEASQVAHKHATGQASHTTITCAAGKGRSYPTPIAANCTACPIDEYRPLSCYISPNPKQPFSQAEDCEQFCYGDGDYFCGFSRVVFTVTDQINQSLHYSK